MQSLIVTKLKNFRDKIFSCFAYRAHASMELIDALSGNTHANSVIELSLSPLFRRRYGSVRNAITHFETDPEQNTRLEHCLIKHCSPITQTQPLRLMVLDCTAAHVNILKPLKIKEWFMPPMSNRINGDAR